MAKTKGHHSAALAMSTTLDLGGAVVKMRTFSECANDLDQVLASPAEEMEG